MKFPQIVAALLITVTLAACADQQNHPKQTVGTLLGAGAGALLGSQIGGGKGRLAAVAIGALGGAFLGSEIGRTMDEVDRSKAAQAQTQALNTAPVGQSIAWSNPDTGHHGTVTPLRDGRDTATGEKCRQYEHSVTIEGRSEVITGTACQRPDGTWRVVN